MPRRTRPRHLLADQLNYRLCGEGDSPPAVLLGDDPDLSKAPKRVHCGLMRDAVSFRNLASPQDWVADQFARESLGDTGDPLSTDTGECILLPGDHAVDPLMGGRGRGSNP